MQVKIIKPVSDKPELAKLHPVGETRKGRLVGGGKHVAIFHMMRGFAGQRKTSRWYPVDCFEILPEAAKQGMCDASRELLNKAFAEVRAAYVARYIELEMARLETVREGLAAADMDAEKYAPYPGGTLARREYQMAQGRYGIVRAWFGEDKSRNKPYRSPYDPYYVIERPETEEKLKAEATRDANDLVDAFLAKMAGKIGVEISAAECNGRIWDGAVLKVATPDEVQTWETKCILNVSCLGKVFNQWPTRRK